MHRNCILSEVLGVNRQVFRFFKRMSFPSLLEDIKMRSVLVILFPQLINRLLFHFLRKFSFSTMTIISLHSDFICSISFVTIYFLKRIFNRLTRRKISSFKRLSWVEGNYKTIHPERNVKYNEQLVGTARSTEFGIFPLYTPGSNWVRKFINFQFVWRRLLSEKIYQPLKWRNSFTCWRVEITGSAMTNLISSLA